MMLGKAKSLGQKIKRGALRRSFSAKRDQSPKICREVPREAKADEQTQVPLNVIQIRNEKKKVQQALKFITFAVERRNMVMLPGSATVALETTLELITLITTLLSSLDTGMELKRRMTAVYASLAELIEWADQVMLTEKNVQIDCDHAKRVIQNIELSVGELVDYACDKVVLVKQVPPDYNAMTLPNKSKLKRQDAADSVKRSSLPDVPLSAAENAVLKETHCGAFDNPLALDRGEATPKHAASDQPPPKPYLPPNFNLQRSLSRSDSTETPPILPNKRRPTLNSTANQDGTPPFPSATIAIAEDLSPVQPFPVPNKLSNGFPQALLRTSSRLKNSASSSFDSFDMGQLTSRIERLGQGSSSSFSSFDNSQVVPPALPGKLRPRIGSDYDNVYEDVPDSVSRVPPLPMMNKAESLGAAVTMRGVAGRTHIGQQHSPVFVQQQVVSHSIQHISPGVYFSMSQRETSTSSAMSSLDAFNVSGENVQKTMPPPLPPKKKHVESYMHVFGGEPTLSEYHPAESLHPRQFYRNVQEKHQWDLFHSPPSYMDASIISVTSPENSLMELHSNSNSFDIQEMINMSEVPTPPALNEASGLDPEPDFDELNILDSLDVKDHLVRDVSDGSKKDKRGLPALKGGSVDALVVYATHVGKHELSTASMLSLAPHHDESDFMYQEAFLTTYRTFINPEELIDKLLYRYNKFSRASDLYRRKNSRNTFSLLVRVIDELTPSELTPKTYTLLLNLVCDLVRSGELTLARILRKKVLEKCDPHQRPAEELIIVAPRSPDYNLTLLDFKSREIAEQMTLLNNDFYQRLELPELFIWSEDQNEEKCPNLVQFTENFNKMSWWCRYMLLSQEDAAVREKYFVKFVHVLKHLRKHNNFNSLLALLSALDSAPVSRLDWPKQATDIVQEHCVLIDSTSSFKSYRLALADAEPPCIPYIGMILMDMTMIRLANISHLPGGAVNFQMRWHLFNVLECLRRFRKPAYPFKKDPKILQFLDGFNKFNSSDDEMWARSKEIKATSTK